MHESEQEMTSPYQADEFLFDEACDLCFGLLHGQFVRTCGHTHGLVTESEARRVNHRQRERHVLSMAR